MVKIFNLKRKYRKSILVSDLHCRSIPCDKVKLLAKLVKVERVECIFILGDLFDKYHRRVCGEELKVSLERLLEPIKNVDVVYVTSRASHDPLIEEILEFKLNNSMVVVSPFLIRAYIGSEEFYLTHGDLAFPSGVVAYAVNTLMGYLGVKLYVEKKLKEKLSLPRNSWLIMGHTHIPGIDFENKVANTGSWKTKWFLDLPYWRPPSKTYIIVDNGVITLKNIY